MIERRKQEIPKPILLDEMFYNQEERDDLKKEKIETINIDLIDDFEKHPFKVLNNDELKSLQESIKTNGILSPILIRPKGKRYEMISGHRRKLACKLLGIEEIPCVIKQLNDDEATIFMVDSNLQREKLLPSEKAFAYKMKYEALKHQRNSSVNQLDTEVCQVGTVVRSDVLLSKELDESARTIQRLIRLTYLIPELLNLVDNKVLGLSPQIALSPGSILSFLKPDEQKMLYEYIDKNLVTPSEHQAYKLKDLSEKGILTEEALYDIMSVEKPNQKDNFKISNDKLRNVLPKNLPLDKTEDFIIRACEHYTKYLKNREIQR